ncbi:unnamed protein product [Prorocentrum cordatum]|uniref:Uncharacterized protein n=1 Tax=Prorocentrum cordatum TaxID=2364126 RepID=A0ABN9W8L2_9DINO|nr:unnamed protein product [Polarella glacialis]
MSTTESSNTPTTVSTASIRAPPQIIGSIGLLFVDPEAVRNGPDALKVLNSLGATIAQVVGTSASYVSTWFAESRRLRAPTRGLSSGSLVVEYSVSVPADAPADIPDLAAMQASLDSVDISSFTSLLQANIDVEVGDGVYEVAVTGITAIAINVPSVTLPEAEDRIDAGLEVEANSIIVGIVISGVVFIGCGSLLLLLGWRSHRRQAGDHVRDAEVPGIPVGPLGAAGSAASARSEKLSFRFEGDKPPEGDPSSANAGSASAGAQAAAARPPAGVGPRPRQRSPKPRSPTPRPKKRGKAQQVADAGEAAAGPGGAARQPSQRALVEDPDEMPFVQASKRMVVPQLGRLFSAAAPDCDDSEGFVDDSGSLDDQCSIVSVDLGHPADEDRSVVSVGGSRSVVSVGAPSLDGARPAAHAGRRIFVL